MPGELTCDEEYTLRRNVLRQLSSVLVFLPFFCCGLVAQSNPGASDEEIPTNLRFMLEDAETMVQEGEYRIARELIDAVRKRSSDSTVLGRTSRLTRRLDRLQFGESPPKSHVETDADPSIVRIPDFIPGEATVAPVTQTVAPNDQNRSTIELSNVDHVANRRAIQIGRPIAPKFASDATETTALPTEPRPVPSLDELTRSLGLAIAESKTKQKANASQPAIPAIVINPPTYPRLVERTEHNSRAYSQQQVTYFSAICFAIGLLTCPAALLVGMAYARRAIGRNGPLFQISVIRQDCQKAPGTQLSPESDSSSREAEVVMAKETGKGEGHSSISPDILPMVHRNDPAVQSTASRPSIYEKIVDHNMLLRRSTSQTAQL